MTIPTWPGGPEWPDQPGYPYPPARPMPRREGPLMVPVVDVPGGAADELRSRRRVLLTGRLDATGATQLCAELMALDGRSADGVELIVNSDGGPLADVLAVLDVIATMRARVATTCIGRAAGTAAVVLACGTGDRRAAPHALISLRTGGEDVAAGPSGELQARADELAAVRRVLVTALVAATGRSEADLADDLDHGPVLDTTEARRLGLIDAVLGAPAG